MVILISTKDKINRTFFYFNNIFKNSILKGINFLLSKNFISNTKKLLLFQKLMKIRS